jgi:hypothetical protein
MNFVPPTCLQDCKKRRSAFLNSDPDARRMFDCLLAYARREGGAGLN